MVQKVFINLLSSLIIILFLSCKDKNNFDYNIIYFLNHIQSGDINSISKLIKQNPVYITRKINGFYPIEYAIYNNDVDTVDFFIKSLGFDYNLLDDNNMDAITYSIVKDKSAVVEYFLKNNREITKSRITNLIINDRNFMKNLIKDDKVDLLKIILNEINFSLEELAEYKTIANNYNKLYIYDIFDNINKGVI